MSMEASQFDQLLAAIHGATGGGGGTTGGATEAKQPAVSPSQGAGVVDAGTQRMVLASDGPTVTALGTTTQTKATDGSATAWSMIQLLKGIFDKLLGTLTVASHAVTNAGTFAVQVSTQVGAANLATGQVATTTAAGTFVVARPTRRAVLLKNLSASITVYYGPATVTTANGMELKAGESVVVNWVGLIQVIAASGTPTVAYSDEYD